MIQQLMINNIFGPKLSKPTMQTNMVTPKPPTIMQSITETTLLNQNYQKWTENQHGYIKAFKKDATRQGKQQPFWIKIIES